SAVGVTLTSPSAAVAAPRPLSSLSTSAKQSRPYLLVSAFLPTSFPAASFSSLFRSFSAMLEPPSLREESFPDAPEQSSETTKRVASHLWRNYVSRLSMAALRFGIFDHVDDSGLPLAEHYATRLRLVEALDTLPFDSYHVAEHHGTPL